MYHSRVSGNEWLLSEGGRVLLTHRPGASFVSAVRQEKSYSASRGSVKTEVVESERVPLTELTQEEENRFLFSGGERRLRVTLAEEKGGVKLYLEGEADWSYEFRLPAEPDEAVFGGGEQYRQMNLRGEQVVNFVSEHIKATTIVEKALVPRPLYREKAHSQIGSYAPMPVFLTDRGG